MASPKIKGTNDILNDVYDKDGHGLKVSGVNVDNVSITGMDLEGELAESIDAKLANISDAMQVVKYGNAIAQRPAASAVPIGAFFMLVPTQELWQSDGTNWVVI